MRVKKAVLPVAGFGTRVLPATKAIPKEMLPVVDRPAIQYVVDEALEAGIEHIVFVTGRNKGAIEDYFDHSYELEDALVAKKKDAILKQVEQSRLPAGGASFTRQQKPLGLGHAVWCARDIIGNEPFAVLLPDVIVKGQPSCLAQMVEAYDKVGGNIIAVDPVPEERVSSYGVIAPVERDGRLIRMSGMVEKPPKGEAPSNLIISGRYILQPEIFKILETQERGAGNEIQLTDGMLALAKSQEFAGYHFKGETYDCGAKDGFIMANIAFALQRPDIRPAIEEPLKALVSKLM